MSQIVAESEKYQVMIGMERFGGGFVKSLGVALRHADSDNTWRIKQAFPEYWQQYKEFGEKIQKENGGN